MMYYAIRLMILALLALAWSGSQYANAGNCCFDSKLEKLEQNRELPPCHQKNAPVKKNKSSGSCRHHCCSSILSTMPGHRAPVLIGSLYFGELKMPDKISGRPQFSPYPQMRPPIV